MPNSKATRKGAGRKIAAARAADSLSQQQRGKEKKKRTEDESGSVANIQIFGWGGIAKKDLFSARGSARWQLCG